jgi:putative phage-type endonuclease
MDREAFLEARKSGIGGSDIAAILGLSPWKTAVDVWLDKTSHAQNPEPNEAMLWGSRLEDVVAEHYRNTTGRSLQRVRQLLRHPKHEWAIGHIDRAVVTPGSRARFDGERLRGADGILEVKTASAYKSGEWGRPDDEDAIPTHYAAQAMWYLGITGLDWCDVPVLIGGQRYLCKRVERDDDTIKGMLERAEEFWRKNVLERIPPEPKTGEDAMKLFPRDSGRVVEASIEAAAMLTRARELKEQIKALEGELEAALGGVKAYMADASAITLSGEVLATWKAQTSNRLDTAALRAAHPDIYAQFLQPSETRVFRFKVA